MTVASNAPPTSAQEAALRTTLESTVGQENQVRNFKVTSTVVNRRALTAADPSPQQQQQQQQSTNMRHSDGTFRRLADYSWQVSFDVVAPLSSTSYATPDAYAASITDAVSSNAFESEVQNNVGVTLDTATVAAVVHTRNPSQSPTLLPSPSPSLVPTPLPTPLPSPQPTPLPTKLQPSSPAAVLAASVLAAPVAADDVGGGGGTSAASTQGLLIGVVLGVVVLLGLVVGGKRYFDQRNKKHGVDAGRSSENGLDDTAAEFNDEPKLQFAGEVELEQSRTLGDTSGAFFSSHAPQTTRSPAPTGFASRYQEDDQEDDDSADSNSSFAAFESRRALSGSIRPVEESASLFKSPHAKTAAQVESSRDGSVTTTFAETAAPIAEGQAAWFGGRDGDESGSDAGGSEEDDNGGLKFMVAENPEGEADLFDMLNELEEPPEPAAEAPTEVPTLIPADVAEVPTQSPAEAPTQSPAEATIQSPTPLPVPPPSMTKMHEAEL